MWTPALGCLGVNMNNIKKVCFICFLFLVFNLAATADEFELNNVKDEYIGTYIPVDLELRLYQSKKFYESLLDSRKYGATRPHDVLYLKKNKCYSDLGFHDGYAIKSKDFNDYKFITGKGGTFCIDNKGFLYRKICNAEHGSSEYAEYIMKIILANFIDSAKIKFDGKNLFIADKKYEVILDGMFFDTSNAAIWLFSDEAYVLERNGINGELYTSKMDEDDFARTKNVLIAKFPVMFKINANEIPDYSKVPKDQLRLFRNLIYARNGYIFKSADLREYYSSCSWYKQNPNFNESAMRKDEKDFIELMLKYEAK